MRRNATTISALANTSQQLIVSSGFVVELLGKPANRIEAERLIATATGVKRVFGTVTPRINTSVRCGEQGALIHTAR